MVKSLITTDGESDFVLKQISPELFSRFREIVLMFSAISEVVKFEMRGLFAAAF